MERFNLHAGLSIPNIETRDKAVVQEGMILAIEPFATVGAGKVGGRGRGSIYRIVRERRCSPELQSMYDKIRSRFGPFPFAGRWCEQIDKDGGAAVQKLYRLGIIMSYPVLTDVASGVVAQAEHSVLVTSDGCRVLT
jgi:methionyl aminopeptidase